MRDVIRKFVESGPLPLSMGIALLRFPSFTVRAAISHGDGQRILLCESREGEQFEVLVDLMPEVPCPGCGETFRTSHPGNKCDSCQEEESWQG